MLATTARDSLHYSDPQSPIGQRLVEAMPMLPPIFLFCCFLSSILCVVAFPSSDDVVGLHKNDKLPVLTFDEGYTRVFGDSNLMLLRDGKAVQISLDERTGAGFTSQDLYLHGFFSASIKLPSDYAAGVVVAFYMSNGDMFENTHDELDFEFLGNVRGKDWRIQTNIYGNGSTSTGREERYGMWFDPTEDFHQYSILWTKDQIIFSIDSIPIREVTRSSGAVGDDVFPSKPMSVYATIWDGSGWATSGGRYKINYKFAPYVAEFSNLVLQGCVVDPIDHSSTCDDVAQRGFKNFTLSTDQQSAMDRFRKEHLTYSYCYDRRRYWILPPECTTSHPVLKNFHNVKYNKFGFRKPHVKHRNKRAASRRSRANASASPGMKLNNDI